MRVLSFILLVCCFILFVIGCQTEKERYIQSLVQQIKYAHNESVPEIETELVELGIESLPHLIKALEIKKVSHQIEAILVKIGNNAVPQLILALQSRNPLVQRRIVRILSNIGGNAHPALIQLTTDKDRNVRCHAIWTLGKIQQKTNNVSQALINSLDDEDADVRCSAVLVLARLGTSRCVSNLIEKLDDEDNRVRSNASYALGSLGSRATEAIVPLLKLLRDEDQVVRLSGLKALEKVGNYAVPILIKELSNEDLIVSGLAASILLGIGSPEAISSVKQMLPSLILMLKMPEIRPHLGKVIHKLGQEIVPHLIVLLKDPSSEIRLSVAKIMGDIGQEAREGIPALVHCFKDPKWEVRIEAEKALGKIGEDAVPTLIYQLENSDQDTKILAVKSLGRIGRDASSAIAPLIKALQDSSSGVRWQSSTALRKIGKDVIPDLIQELKNPNLEVCHSVIRTLGQIGSDAEVAVPLLIQLVQNDDESTRRLSSALATSSIAIEALEQIGTRPALDVVAKYDKKQRLR